MAVHPRYQVLAKSISSDAYALYGAHDDLEQAKLEAYYYFDEEGFYSAIEDTVARRIIYIDHQEVDFDAFDPAFVTRPERK
jgi:hypothetical protein